MTSSYSLELAAQQPAAAAQAGRAFQRAEHQVAQLVAHRCDLLGRARRLTASSASCRLQLVHPLRRFLQLAHQRLHAAGPQAQFLDQHEHLVAAADEARAGGRLLVGRSPCGWSAGRSRCFWPLHQVLQQRQVVRHAGLDLLLGQPLGQRHLDRAIERQLARCGRAPASSPSHPLRRTTAACCGGNACGSARSSWPGEFPPPASAAGSPPSATGTCESDRSIRAACRR